MTDTLKSRLRSGAVTPDDLEAAADRIDALEAGPRVKPLVWSVFGKECIRAETALCRYDILWGFHNGKTALVIYAPRPANVKKHTWHPNEEAALAAGQADWERRILAALEPAPVSDEALRGAALEAADRAEKFTECCQSCAGVGRPIRALATEDATIAAIRERAKGC